ncbi:MAG: tetratricopeptide repeat protein [Gammaproteobacteria bacterium]|nr:tetratricopeptide repeat protein [Gammaproteobacteria bacterium]
MANYETEEQQLQAIKSWWNKHGNAVSWILLVVMAAVAGGRYWIAHKEQLAESAATEFAQLRNELHAGNYEAVEKRVKYIQDSFGDSPYAVQAALLKAKADVDQNKLPDAETALQWVLDHEAQPEIKAVARLRLARVLASEGQQERALTVLGQGDSGTLLAGYEEARGDIYRSMGRVEDARMAYQKALLATPKDQDRRILQMKVDDLGGAATS